MIVVTVAAAWWGVLPGLHTTPDHPGWARDRLLWLPAFAIALTLAWLAFRRFERPSGGGGEGRPAATAVAAA